jgi:hypothetical protein
MKRHTLRASAGSYLRSAHAPERLEDEIQALTNESIEKSLDEIEIAFLRRFGTKQGPARERKKLPAD